MRLVDADELEKAICGRCKESKDGKWSIDCLWISCKWGDVMPVIQKLPIVDAQPVTHGEWIPAEMNAENKENAEMHHKSGAYACVIAYLEGESPIWRCAEFMENKLASCSKCIAAYLNERSE